MVSFIHNNVHNIMARSRPKRLEEAKEKALREQGVLHRHADMVQDEAFRSHEFFDACDLVQVRYEMLRRHRVDERALSEVAASFGVNRQALYKTKTAFQEQGIAGLLPRRRGPKGAHKCTEEILDFVEQWRSTRSADATGSVVEAIERRFGVTMNPRSIERALARHKKRTKEDKSPKMTSLALDPSHIQDQYKALCREVIEADSAGGGGHGLALFLLRGMVASLSALSAAGQGLMAPKEDRSP